MEKLKKFDTPIRILLGVFFIVFGSNGLMAIFIGGGFIPMPPPPEQMAQIMGGFFGAVYLMPLVKIVELSTGIMFVANKYTNLALIMLAPVLVNILLVHIVADLAGIVAGLFASILWAILFRNRWAQLKVIFEKNTKVAA